MLAEITIRIDLDGDESDLAALRDIASSTLVESGASVMSTSCSWVQEVFHVVGVELPTGEPFHEVVMAVNKSEAEKMVSTADMVVANVSPGRESGEVALVSVESSADIPIPQEES
jgi:hypothetical protein